MRKVNWSSKLINWHWDKKKKKKWVPYRNRAHDLSNTGRALYSLSYKKSCRTKFMCSGIFSLFHPHVPLISSLFTILKLTIFIHLPHTRWLSSMQDACHIWTQLSDLLSMNNRSSVDRAPALCPEGHGFDSCRGLRFSLCPTVVSCWSIHFFSFHTELKIHHLYSFRTEKAFTAAVLCAPVKG